MPYSILEWLEEQYEVRRRRNAKFSRRAFARMIGLSPSMLTGLRTRGKKLSPDRILTIADRLAVPPGELVLIQLISVYERAGEGDPKRKIRTEIDRLLAGRKA